VRDLVADAVEVVERQRDLGLAGDGQQVEDGVGRASEGHDDRDGVLERLLRHDLPGGDALAEQLDDGLTGLVGEVVATVVDRGRGGGAGQAHAEGLCRRGHRVGREHAAAGALAGTDRALDLVDLLTGDQALDAGSDSLERVDDRDVLAVDVARHDRPGVEEDARQVEPGGGHQHARQALVAAGEQDRSVEALGHHDRLDRVGDDLAADEREVHALVAHRDAVGDRDRAELEWVAAAGVHAHLDGLGEPVEGQVAGRDLVPAGRDADLGLRPVVVTHADRAEHAARCGGLEAIGDGAAAGLDVDVVLGGHAPKITAQADEPGEAVSPRYPTSRTTWARSLSQRRRTPLPRAH
jgi:hypothetical protein